MRVYRNARSPKKCTVMSSWWQLFCIPGGWKLHLPKTNSKVHRWKSYVWEMFSFPFWVLAYFPGQTHSFFVEATPPKTPFMSLETRPLQKRRWKNRTSGNSDPNLHYGTIQKGTVLLCPKPIYRGRNTAPTPFVPQDVPKTPVVNGVIYNPYR